jgi:hypothetical protein
MKRIFFKGRYIFIPLGIIAFLSLISLIVMTLWNNLLPDIIHVGTINFWQAMGIFILSKILFGFGGGHRRGGGNWMNKCKSMTPEDREKFRAEMKERMCFVKDRQPGKQNDNQEEPQNS